MEPHERGRQRWAIAVLLGAFAVATIVSTVSAIIAWQRVEQGRVENVGLTASIQRSGADSTQLRAEAEKRQTRVAQLEVEAKALRHVLGYDVDAPGQAETLRRAREANPQTAAILNAFESAVKQYGEGLANEVNYRTMLEFVAHRLAISEKEAARRVEAVKTMSDHHAHTEETLLQVVPIAAQASSPHARQKVVTELGNYAMRRKWPLSAHVTQQLAQTLERLEQDPDELVRSSAKATLQELKSGTKPTPPTPTSAGVSTDR